MDQTATATTQPDATADTATAAAVPALDEVLDRLSRYEASHLPVVSLYLNLQPDQHGKDNFAPFVRKELPARVKGYPAGSEARDSLDKDAERIERYLANEVPPSANGLAIYACAGADFFEAVPLDAPIPAHRLSIAPEPHVYPLALLLDQHPPHAVVVADGHAARIFVFALGQKIDNATVEAREKIKRTSAGGWSQMRYQRHVQELLKEHARELIGELETLVKRENIQHIILAGEEISVATVRAELSQELAAKVIDAVKLDPKSPDQEVMAAATEALRRHDAKTDAEVVARVVGDYLAGGLGTVGVEEVRKALEIGQVSELYLTAIDAGTEETLADELVARAKQTSASVRFIEDRALLEQYDGVAASLRYRLDNKNGGNGAGDQA
jgi:peptide chain release factor subunit 1